MVDANTELIQVKIQIVFLIQSERVKIIFLQVLTVTRLTLTVLSTEIAKYKQYC